MPTVFTLQMLDQNEHNEWSHQRNWWKVLTGKHPTSHTLHHGFSQGKMARKAARAQPSSLLCARVASPDVHLTERILESHGDPKADGGQLRDVGVSHRPREHGDRDIWALCPRRAEKRRTLQSLWCQDGGCKCSGPYNGKCGSR